MIKGLKKLGILALSAVIAMGTVTVALPAKEVWAGEYVEQTGFDKMELSEWRFADGIVVKNVSFSLLKEDGSVDLGDTSENIKRLVTDDTGNYGIYHFMLKNGFKWEGNTYDVHVEMKQYRTDTYTLTGGIEDWASYQALEGSGINVFQFSGKNKGAYWLDYKIWLEKDGKKVSTLGKDAVPFIFGPIWNSMLEVNTVYSSEAVYTNICENASELGNLTEYYSNGGLSGYKMKDNNRNETKYYFAGTGHRDDAVLGRYGLTSGNGELEFRMGYRAYSLQYVTASGAQIVPNTIPSKEMVPVPDSTNPGSPSDNAGSIQPTSGNKITKFKLKEVFLGDDDKKIEVPSENRFVTLADGTKINVDSEIKPSQIPQIKMDKNVVIEVYTIPEDQVVNLKYHFNNDQIPKQPAHDDTPGNPNLVENYKRYTGAGTEDPTSNGSLKPGVVITGKDNQKYRLVDWFEDEAFTNHYEFGENLTVDKDIYAKWELVVDPPKPDPDPDPDPDPSSDSGSTQTPATVAPAAPAPLPAGTVRVSPKTGDTTIPPIYYVMSAAALAGIGFLVFRRRGKN